MPSAEDALTSSIKLQFYLQICRIMTASRGGTVRTCHDLFMELMGHDHTNPAVKLYKSTCAELSCQSSSSYVSSFFNAINVPLALSAFRDKDFLLLSHLSFFWVVFEPDEDIYKLSKLPYVVVLCVRHCLLVSTFLLRSFQLAQNCFIDSRTQLVVCNEV